jgi:hypothetical protein
MADYDKDIPTDAVLFNPNMEQPKPTPFNFQKRQAAIEARKAKIAQLMRNQRFAPEMPQGSMVSGHYVAPSWTQQLSAVAQPLAQQYMTGREQEALGKEQEEFESEDRKAAIAHAMQAPGVVASGEDREGNPIVPPATPQGKIQWAERGMNIPSRRDLLKQLIADQTIQEPIRAEARSEKRFEREDKQAEALRKQEADLAARREEAEKKREQDEKESKRRSEDQRFIAGQAHLDRRASIAAALNAKAGVETPTRAKERQKLEAEVGAAHQREAALIEVEDILPGATGSGVGAAVDQLAGIVGYAPAGAKATAQLQALEGRLLASIPKFSGPTSDKDVAVYREMVGRLANPELPVSARQAALKTVKEMSSADWRSASSRANQFNTGSGDQLPIIDVPEPPPRRPKMPSRESGGSVTPAAPAAPPLPKGWSRGG